MKWLNKLTADFQRGTTPRLIQGSVVVSILATPCHIGWLVGGHSDVVLDKNYQLSHWKE